MWRAIMQPIRLQRDSLIAFSTVGATMVNGSVYVTTERGTFGICIPRAGAWDGARNSDERSVLDEADFRVPRGVEFRRAAPRYGCCLRLAPPRPGVLYNFGAVVDYVGHASPQVIRVPCESDAVRGISHAVRSCHVDARNEREIPARR